MARRQTHDRFPRGRRMTLLDVVVDEARVAPGSVEAFTQILEEHPDEHGADRQPHDCQTVCYLRLPGHYGCFISQRGSIRCHSKPRPEWILYQIGAIRQAQILS